MTLERLTSLLRVGCLLVVVNLVAWPIVIALAPPVFDSELAAAPESSASTMMTCWDCGRFVIVGRELGSYWDPVPVKLFLALNLPPLRLTSNETAPFDQLQVQTPFFVVAAVMWWLLIGTIVKIVWTTLRGMPRRTARTSKPIA